MIKVCLMLGTLALAYSPAYASSASLLVGKSFLEISLTDDQTSVSVDDQPFLSERVISVNDAQEGAHTLSVQVPQGAKLFYALCGGGPFVDAGVGPDLIRVSFEVKDSWCRINLVFTLPEMTYGVRIIE